MLLLLLLLPLHALLAILSAANPQPPLPNAAADHLTLLSLKSSLTSGGSDDSLASWNDTAGGICHWKGVTCSWIHPERVASLQLPSLGLSGTIPASITNLTFLSHLDLSGNNLRGRIPTLLPSFKYLTVLDLHSNSLQGSIPETLTNCSTLKYLHLNDNNLSGAIPPSIGNLTSLKELSLSSNSLRGGIPPELGLLPSIELLDLLFNHLSGEIPPTLFNISSLYGLGLGGNLLSGPLSPDMGANLPNLLCLFLYDNDLQGPIPPSLAKASNLFDVQLSQNSLTGVVPPVFNSLPLLETLLLDDNNLTNEGPEGWRFLTSLSSCVYLKILDLSGNDFAGGIPDSFGNLPADLGWLRLRNNRLSGPIPPEIVGIENLVVLDLEGNRLSDTIPDIFGNFTKMKGMSLARNMLSGEIPRSISSLVSLCELYLNNNNLSGRIPESLSMIQNLAVLDISHNNLTGGVPKGVISSFSSLTVFLNMSHNNLMGELPPEIGRLVNLNVLDISHNNFSGEIPSSYLKSCLLLEHLHMQSNSFNGTIPPGLAHIKGLQFLDLSRNGLEGEVPRSLETMRVLRFLNLSFNNLQGAVPTGGIFGDPQSFSIEGNDNLCGGHPMLKLKPCHWKRTWTTFSVALAAIVASAIVVASCIIVPLFVNLLKKEKYSVLPLSKRRMWNARRETRLLLSLKDRVKEVSYADLELSTNFFSDANLIGTGGFGCLYRGFMKGEEKEIAVKVFDTQIHGSSKSFQAELKALRNARHRNLLRIIASCSSSDSTGNGFKALVYEFVPNGSLHTWLHRDVEVQMRLGFYKRLDIAIDVASALEYLHHQIEMPIVHCDLKPSNVLLDASMNAQVGDFGISMFVSAGADSVDTVEVRGSIGYIAPERGAGSPVSPLWDVYSFGMLLLEMFTGKEPADQSLVDDLNLRKYVENSFPENIEDILDPNMFPEEKEGEMSQKERDSLTLIVEIALICSNELAKERMEITEALKKLEVVKKNLLEIS